MDTSPTRLMADPKVVSGQGMSPLAMRLGRPPLTGHPSSITPPNVLASGHRFHVARIDTPPVAAKVIDREAFGDRPDEEFIQHTVGVSRRLATSSADLAVASGVLRGGPFPTSIIDEELPENPLSDRLCGQRHVNPAFSLRRRCRLGPRAFRSRRLSNRPARSPTGTGRRCGSTRPVGGARRQRLSVGPGAGMRR